MGWGEVVDWTRDGMGVSAKTEKEERSGGDWEMRSSCSSCSRSEAHNVGHGGWSVGEVEEGGLKSRFKEVADGGR